MSIIVCKPCSVHYDVPSETQAGTLAGICRFCGISVEPVTAAPVDVLDELLGIPPAKAEALPPAATEAVSEEQTEAVNQPQGLVETDAPTGGLTEIDVKPAALPKEKQAVEALPLGQLLVPQEMVQPGRHAPLESGVLDVVPPIPGKSEPAREAVSAIQQTPAPIDEPATVEPLPPADAVARLVARSAGRASRDSLDDGWESSSDATRGSPLVASPAVPLETPSRASTLPKSSPDPFLADAPHAVPALTSDPNEKRSVVSEDAQVSAEHRPFRSAPLVVAESEISEPPAKDQWDTPPKKVAPTWVAEPEVKPPPVAKSESTAVAEANTAIAEANTAVAEAKLPAPAELEAKVTAESESESESESAPKPTPLAEVAEPEVKPPLVAEAEGAPPRIPAWAAEADVARPLVEDSHSRSLKSDATRPLDDGRPFQSPLPAAGSPFSSGGIVSAEPGLSAQSLTPFSQAKDPEELRPSSSLRRYAPLAAGIAAIGFSFLIGVQVGRSGSTPAAPEILAAASKAPEPGAPTTADGAAKLNPDAAAAAVPLPEDAIPHPPSSAASLADKRPAAKGYTRRFNAKAAHASLAKATARARGCKKAGDPAGVAQASVTFAANGTVSNVNVAGARIAGTAMGNCIADALSVARVPAFTGEAATVKRTLKFK